MKDLFGIDIIESDRVAPDTVLLVDGKVLAAPGAIQRLIFLNEIRSIVQRGLKAAFPDLVIPRPPRKSDHDSRPAMDLGRVPYFDQRERTFDIFSVGDRVYLPRTWRTGAPDQGSEGSSVGYALDDLDESEEYE